MRDKYTLAAFLAIILLQATLSCSDKENMTDTAVADNNKFLTTLSDNYDISLTRNASTKKVQISDSNISGYITESDWYAKPTESTRAFIVGNKVTWDDIPNVALFIKDASSESFAVKDRPLTPATHYLYNYYYNPIDYGEDANKYVSKQTIQNSDFFWDNYASDNENTIFDFYGYCPRPYNRQGDDVKYTSESVINETDARSGKTLLNYTFQTEQKDDNLRSYDLMVAMPEEASEYAYGCINKKRGDNVQLRFRHLFSCLMITINRGTYQGDCKISSLKIAGTQVKNSGTLNIETGTIQQGTEYEPITRNIPVTNIEKDKPLETEMILQPTTDDEVADAGNDTERLKIICVIDGAEYSCPLTNLKLKGGKKYHINLTLTPTDIVTFQVWDGAKVKLGDNEHGKGTFLLTQKDIKSFKVELTDNSSNDIYVCKDGILYNPTKDNSSVYNLEIDKGKNTIYNIVVSPQNTNWYVTDSCAILFDATWRDKFNKENQSLATKTWSDLSGHNNDGTLIAFDTPNEKSGWTLSGLNFDGINDIVTFPGHISSGNFTIEMYVNISSTQYADSETKPYKRLFGEPDNMDSGFLALYIGDSANRFGFFGLGHDTYFGNNGQIVFDELVQYDFIFDNGTLTVYKNGVYGGQEKGLQYAREQTLASIGGRIKDNSRNLRSTYYSFILYDKALKKDEINHNYSINKTRYSEAKH